MKHSLMTLTILFSLFSCKSNKTATDTLQKEILVQYSKGPCLGNRCPVYDFWVYTNGDFFYKSTKGLKSNREKQGTLSAEELSALQTALKREMLPVSEFKMIRDMPIVTLKFNNNTHKYYASKVKGESKNLETFLDDMVKKTQALTNG